MKEKYQKKKGPYPQHGKEIDSALNLERERRGQGSLKVTLGKKRKKMRGYKKIGKADREKTQE